MLRRRYIFIYFFTIVLFILIGFSLGRYTTLLLSQLPSTNNGRAAMQQSQERTENGNTSKFSGAYYQISFPSAWKFEGPTEGPITGFPEFAKIVSPTGDLSIYVGLRGDNRFEFNHDDIQSRLEGTVIKIGDKFYNGEEEFFDIDGQSGYDMVALEVELDDARNLGFSNYSKQVLLPVKIQVLYRFSTDGELTFEQKMSNYRREKEQALKILETFRFRK